MEEAKQTKLKNEVDYLLKSFQNKLVKNLGQLIILQWSECLYVFEFMCWHRMSTIITLDETYWEVIKSHGQETPWSF